MVVSLFTYLSTPPYLMEFHCRSGKKKGPMEVLLAHPLDRGKASKTVSKNVVLAPEMRQTSK